jgi:hypothetical protein
MISSMNKISHRVCGQGNGNSRLGRWTWTKCKGVNNITFKVIMAYRPCCPTTAGELMAYSQQERYMSEKDDTRNPREAILEDLMKEMREWYK